jgi:hypothetical protein
MNRTYALTSQNMVAQMTAADRPTTLVVHKVCGSLARLWSTDVSRWSRVWSQREESAW